MTMSVCFIKSDLSLVRPMGEVRGAGWSAPPISESDRGEIAPYLERVRLAVNGFLNSGARRRIDTLVVDVDESVCMFVRTPSVARPVLAATVRTASQDWGELAPITGIEPLVDSSETKKTRKEAGEPEGATAESGISVAVLSQTDALVRLWLDGLDARGSRATAVVSLWHAIATAWGAGKPGVTLSVLAEPHRLVWAWSRGENLLCGGTTAVATPDRSPDDSGAESPGGSSDPLATAMKRVSLDWLTWAGHLGVTPDQAVIVGPGAAAAREALSLRWDDVPVTAITEADAVGATCAAVEKAGVPPVESRRCLIRLTQRPTRATRWKYGWTAAALVILGLGLGGLGYRLVKSKDTIVEGGRELREQLNARATTVIANPMPGGFIVTELQSVVDKLKLTPAFQPPDPPPKIAQELSRLASTLAKHEGTKLQRVALYADRGELNITVPERRVGEELASALATGGPMVWSQPRDSSGNFTNLTLSGTWKPEGGK